MAAAPAAGPATLRIVSRSTIITGAPDAPVNIPPGTPVALDALEAEGLIARGIATRADAPPPQHVPAVGATITAETGVTLTQE